jgi:hypothetical protein
MPELKKVSIAEFKELTKCNSFSVVKNPNTNKLFVSTDNGKNFRCQADIITSEPVHFIGEDNENLCLVNVGRGENTLTTF